MSEQARCTLKQEIFAAFSFRGFFDNFEFPDILILRFDQNTIILNILILW